MKKLALITFLILATLSSCSKDKETENDNHIIKISTSINGLTRAVENQFEENDVIKVYAYENGDISKMKIDGVDNTYNGFRWTTVESMVWTERDKNYDFLAVFPNFSITGDEFTSKNYTLREHIVDNDLLVATNTGINNVGVSFKQAGLIDLNFDHIMSKITVKLTFKSDFVASAVSRVVLKAKTSATINFISKEVSVTGIVEEKSLTKVEDDYVTIAVPQTILSRERMIEVYMVGDNVPYVFFPTTEIMLEAKKHRIFNLTVGADRVILLNNVTIADWGKSDDMSGSAQQ